MYFARQERKHLCQGRLKPAWSHQTRHFDFLFKKVDLDGLQLGKTFVGKSKDNLVAPDLVAADVIHTLELKNKKDVLRNDVIGQLRGGFMQVTNYKGFTCCSEGESCNEIHSQLQTNGKLSTLLCFAQILPLK